MHAHTRFAFRFRGTLRGATHTARCWQAIMAAANWCASWQRGRRWMTRSRTVRQVGDHGHGHCHAHRQPASSPRLPQLEFQNQDEGHLISRLCRVCISVDASAQACRPGSKCSAFQKRTCRIVPRAPSHAHTRLFLGWAACANPSCETLHDILPLILRK
jgi:hypothetical protein